MMNEASASSLPQVTVLVAIVDQRVAGTAVLPLQGGRGGNHLHAGEVPRSPAPLLRLGPGTARQACEDDRQDRPHSLIEFHCIRKKIERVEEVGR